MLYGFREDADYVNYCDSYGLLLWNIAELITNLVLLVIQISTLFGRIAILAFLGRYKAMRVNLIYNPLTSHIVIVINTILYRYEPTLYFEMSVRP